MAESRFKGSQSKSRFKGPQNREAYWDSSREGMDTLTMGGSTKGSAAVGALVDAAIGAVRGEGFNYSDAYNQNLSDLRAAQAKYGQEHPYRALAGNVGGTAIGIAKLPMIGSGLSGVLKTGAGYGAVGGALEDANSVWDRISNAIWGAGTGAAITGTAYGGGKAIGYGLDTAGKAIKNMRLPPDIRAAGEIADVADARFGPNAAHVMDFEIAKYGPEAVRVDVLGEQGRAVARQAANVSPVAREQIETFAAARKGNQNVRLVSDVQKAGGVEQGSRKTVEELQKDAYDKVRPTISAAYNAAREAGADVPFEYFADVLNTPVGKKAFEQASENVATRMATRGEGGGNLAVLDETQRILSKMANKGYRESDHMADVYADLSKHLKAQMDVLLDGNQYAAARGLRQGAYKAEEAFKLGEELGQRNVPMNLPKAVAKVEPQNAPNVAAAWAQTKAQRLLNNANTEGALTEFVTPMGRDASKAALGDKGVKVLDQAVEREKLFNLLNKALGNSTTARQMAEIGGAGLTGGAIGGYLSDYDPATMTIMGVLSALARKTGPKMAQKMTSAAQQKTAPELAKLLTGKGALPQGRVPATTRLEKLSRVNAESLVKGLMLELQKTNPQTNRAQ